MNVDALTYGEKLLRVRIGELSDSTISDVYKVKTETAKLINTIASLHQPESKFREIDNPNSTKEEYREVERRQWERDKYMGQAIDYLELASMYAVKAVTS